ncbi:MAG: M28 family peptidase [bacterium]
MRQFIAFILILPVLALATEYLVSIPVDIRKVEGQNWLSSVNILIIGKNYLIVRTNEQNLPLIPKYTTIDINPQEKEYLQVYTRAEDGKARVMAIGTILFEEDEFLLIRKEQDFPDSFNIEGILAIVPLSMEPVITDEKRTDIPIFEYNDAVSEIVANISETSYMGYIQSLQDFATRYSKKVDIFKNACEYVKEVYESFGYNTYLDYFDLISQGFYPCNNVVAEKIGEQDPTKIFILCGHLDSTASGNPYELAPGGDDNASGSSAAMEGARVMSNYNFKYTIRFLNFGAEEQGLVGSRYYAKSASENKENIAGVVNLDMVLYAPPGSVAVWVPYNSNSQWLAEFFKTASNTYVPDLNVEIEYNPNTNYSDHASFWSYGYPAILEIEKAVWTNPYYHKTSDRLENYLVYFPFGTNAIKSAIATIASLAEPIGGSDITLEYFTARSDEDGVVLSWDITDKTRGAFNIYKLQEEYTTIGGLEYGYLNTKIEGVWVRLNDHPIEGKGPYIYIDTTAKEGAMSKYRLCAVEDGIESVLSTTSITYRYYEPLSIVSVYPMPCYKEATISVKGADENSISYRVYDISGRLVSEGSGEISDSRVSIKLPGLSNSVYLLEITSGDERAVARIVSMRQ